jgi:peptidoglycan/LPS O-acetylase OafA/YrhL
MRPVLAPSRVTELDGLRGAAALSVCIFHFFCMVHPPLAHNMNGDQAASMILHTPISALWNGHLAVMIFFVLSGFVISAATARKDAPAGMIVIIRYLRLAVPVTASVVFAWVLLTIFPTAAASLAAVQETPAIWLDYTIQGEIPALWWALYDGLLRNFVVGGSDLNNVLWTMRYELVGSVALILIYRLTPPWARVALLGGIALSLIALNQPRYLAFALGGLLYESTRAGSLPRTLDGIGIGTLVAGMGLGSLATDTLPRYGISVPDLPVLRSVGYADSFPMLGAAGLVLVGVMISPSLRRLFSARIPQYLGRISFGLYLVHAPLLYTLVAALAARGTAGAAVLLAIFLTAAFATAHLLTVAVEAPLLRGLTRLSRKRPLRSSASVGQVPSEATERIRS